MTHTYLYLIVRKVFYICFANSMTVKINQSTIVYMIINLFRIKLKDFWRLLAAISTTHYILIIYTLSTHYLHTIFSQYLHNIYTLQVTGRATTARAPASARLASRGRSAPTPALLVTIIRAGQILPRVMSVCISVSPPRLFGWLLTDDNDCIGDTRHVRAAVHGHVHVS